MIPLRLVIDTNVVVSAALAPEGMQRTVLIARDDPTCTVVCLGCNRGGICRGLGASGT
jgi:hypothetical protein